MLPHDMDELFSPILYKPGAKPLEGCVLSIRLVQWTCVAKIHVLRSLSTMTKI